MKRKKQTMLDEEIAWKGIGDYLSAARTLDQHGSSNTSGPRTLCQGLAVELALKLCLHHRDGEYPAIHDLSELASMCAASVQWTDEENQTIRLLNQQYLNDGKDPYPARYRPVGMRVIQTPGQKAIEQVTEKAVSASHPHLLKSILSR